MTTAKLLELTTRKTPGLFERLRLSFEESYRRRAARRSLMGLNDHLLRDIGLSRHSILSDEI